MVTLPRTAQIPSEATYQHETARVLFGPNVRALKWIKGQAIPGALVDEILSALGLDRETVEGRSQRSLGRVGSSMEA